MGICSNTGNNENIPGVAIKVDRFLTKCNVRHYVTYNSVRMDFRCILVPLAALSVQY